jgi:AraC-like DNA-binding protein
MTASYASTGPLEALSLSTAPRLWIGHRDAPSPVSCASGGRAHVHHFFEFVYIAGGTGWHRVGDRTVTVEPGDLLLVAPGELHDSSGISQADRWVVAFGADALDPAYSDTGAYLAFPDEVLLFTFFQGDAAREHFHISPDERPRWEAHLAELEEEMIRQRSGYVQAAAALLTLLLTHIARLAQLQLTQHRRMSRPLLSQVFRFIDAHYPEHVSLSDVAEAVGYTPAYLTDLIRRDTGRTVLAWITERRMAAARYLLLETDATVEQVAERVGYRKASHFIAQFRRTHGTTPHAWRLRERAPHTSATG